MQQHEYLVDNVALVCYSQRIDELQALWQQLVEQSERKGTGERVIFCRSTFLGKMWSNIKLNLKLTLNSVRSP